MEVPGIFSGLERFADAKPILVARAGFCDPRAVVRAPPAPFLPGATRSTLGNSAFSASGDSMVNNLPVKTLVHKELTIEGYSRAAVQTYWRIPELKIGFDLGGQPWSFMGTPTWFVSHTHLDHLAALPVYVARRRMMKMEPPVIYLPEQAIETVRANPEVVHAAGSRPDAVRAASAAAGRRNRTVARARRDRLGHQAHGAVAGLRGLGAAAKAASPSIAQLAGHEIRDLRLAGTEVTEERRIARVAYLGDSSPEGLDATPAMYEAQVLIMEMTFVAPSHRKDKIHKFGHIHLDDIVERRERFHNEVVIASHFSTRYPAKRIKDLVARALPDALEGRLHLWL